MKRRVVINDDVLKVQSAAYTLTTFAPSWATAITVKRTNENEFVATLVPEAQKHWEVAPHVTSKELLFALVNFFTRTEVKQKTDMHQIIESFLQGQTMNGKYLFNDNGDAINRNVSQANNVPAGSTEKTFSM
ncbi:hypothetical protein [Legionella septentrionalis]|uniref:hypothetical protein n=1 Tax=Legionella septentrionalis TaxID=2498109 RepID=UPI000F8EB2C0|nr:hypothetical protein [Legionella septentrionalis]RUQ96451.1 hypothetical protein ELY11_07965 [Legionella septentrionalis]